jgi:TonB-dependent receptor
MSLKLKTIVTALIAVFAGINATAQNGSIAGVVTEKDNGAAVIGAAIMLDSNKVAAVTDFDGKYKVSVKPGTYTVTCKFIGMAPAVVKGVVVQAGKQSVVDLQLSPMLDTLGVTVIWGERVVDSPVAAVEEARKDNKAQDFITAKEFNRTQATSGVDVARKMPGVTIQDNRFVVVRGLSERYNSVLLNNVFAPSAETDVKAFSFDLLPSQMIDKFSIYKTPSPDLPGEFAGGAIRVFTRNIPDQTSLVLNYSTGFRSGTTFEPFSMNRGDISDAFALGAKDRALPSNFPVNLRDQTLTPQQIQDAGRSLRNDWDVTTKPAQLDQRFSATYALRVSKVTRNKKLYQFGNISSLNYSNTNQYFLSERQDYNVFNQITMMSDTVFAYKDDIYTNRVRIGFVQNNAIRFGKDGNNQIDLKHLFNQMGDNETTLRGGKNIEEGDYRNEVSYRYSQRLVYSAQLGGQHTFKKNNGKLDWTLAYSTARRTDPDWRRARRTRSFAVPETDPYSLYLPFSAQPFFLGRLFLNVSENIYASTANWEQQVTVGADESKQKKGYSFTFKTGVYIEEKSREFSVRNLGYKTASPINFDYSQLILPIADIFDTARINNTTGIAIDEDTKKADSYLAGNTMQAGYIMAVFPIGSFKSKETEEILPRIRLNIGARMERNIQRLNSNTIPGDTVIVNNNLANLLPSVNIAWSLTDKVLLRGAYGKTLNRPEFREIAPLYFYDFIFNSINLGNSLLRNAKIDNFDLRCEYYPAPGQNINFGVFYKRFKDPIEIYFVPGVGSGGTRSFTWGNAPLANNWGVEAEIRKQFTKTTVPVIRNMGVVANVAYIFSAIELTDDSIGNKNNQRPMMGQSPYVINATVFWQNDSTGWQINAAYNVVGERVVIVGIPDIPAVYEMPRHNIDLSVMKTLGKNRNIDVRFNVNDLLNQPFLLLQDANDDGKLDRRNDQQMQSFRRGTYFTFGVTVRLLEPTTVVK